MCKGCCYNVLSSEVESLIDKIGDERNLFALQMTFEVLSKGHNVNLERFYRKHKEFFFEVNEELRAALTTEPEGSYFELLFDLTVKLDQLEKELVEN